jgi:hypothetical protein
MCTKSLCTSLVLCTLIVGQQTDLACFRIRNLITDQAPDLDPNSK